MKEKDLKDFEIKEDNVKYKDLDVKASLEDLENFDFSSNVNPELDEYYEMIKLLKSNEQIGKDKDLVQFNEAENVIKREGEKFLGKEVVEQYQKEINNLKAFLKKYEVNTDLVKNMTEVEKDKVYAIAEYLFNGFQKIHNNLVFIFPLTFDEYKFINEVLVRKLEYDRDGLFQVRELKTNYNSRYPKFLKDSVTTDSMTTTIDINSLMILYHHITRYKTKGFQTEGELYISMIEKMEERLMLYNAYKIITERISQEFVVWGGAITIDEIGLKVDDNEVEIKDNTELKVVDEMTGKEK